MRLRSPLLCGLVTFSELAFGEILYSLSFDLNRSEATVSEFNDFEYEPLSQGLSLGIFRESDAWTITIWKAQAEEDFRAAQGFDHEAQGFRLDYSYDLSAEWGIFVGAAHEKVNNDYRFNSANSQVGRVTIDEILTFQEISLGGSYTAEWGDTTLVGSVSLAYQEDDKKRDVDFSGTATLSLTDPGKERGTRASVSMGLSHWMSLQEDFVFIPSAGVGWSNVLSGNISSETVGRLGNNSLQLSQEEESVSGENSGFYSLGLMLIKADYHGLVYFNQSLGLNPSTKTAGLELGLAF